eukprot:Opistho-2@30103
MTSLPVPLAPYAASLIHTAHETANNLEKALYKATKELVGSKPGAQSLEGYLEFGYQAHGAKLLATLRNNNIPPAALSRHHTVIEDANNLITNINLGIEQMTWYKKCAKTVASTHDNERPCKRARTDASRAGPASPATAASSGARASTAATKVATSPAIPPQAAMTEAQRKRLHIDAFVTLWKAAIGSWENPLASLHPRRIHVDAVRRALIIQRLEEAIQDIEHRRLSKDIDDTLHTAYVFNKGIFDWERRAIGRFPTIGTKPGGPPIAADDRPSTIMSTPMPPEACPYQASTTAALLERMTRLDRTAADAITQTGTLTTDPT